MSILQAAAANPESRSRHSTTIRRILFFAVIAALAGCNESLPTAPSPAGMPVDTSGQLYGTVFVLGSGGRCLPGATIEVLAGPAIGKMVRQDQCLDEGRGYHLTGLTPGSAVKIGARAHGYWSQERSVHIQPAGPGADGHLLNFELFKVPDLTLGFIYGTVWSSEGCLSGARIDVLNGSAAGKAVIQSGIDCSNNDGSGNSYFLTELPLGTPIRIRASLPGYQPEERSILPYADSFAAGNHAADFTLKKSP
jgi:hypothetical protein